MYAAHHQRPKLTPAFAKRSIAFGPAAPKAAVPQQLAGAVPAKAVAASGPSKRHAGPCALPAAKRSITQQKAAAPAMAAGMLSMCHAHSLITVAGAAAAATARDPAAGPTMLTPATAAKATAPKLNAVPSRPVLAKAPKTTGATKASATAGSRMYSVV